MRKEIVMTSGDMLQIKIPSGRIIVSVDLAQADHTASADVIQFQKFGKFNGQIRVQESSSGAVIRVFQRGT